MANETNVATCKSGWISSIEITHHHLQLTKPATIVAQVSWARNRDAILNALNSIGPLKVQQQVLDVKWCLDPAVATSYPDSLHAQQIKQPQESAHHPSLDTTAIWPASDTILNASQSRKRALREVDHEGQVINAPDAKRRKVSAPIPEIIDLSD